MLTTVGIRVEEVMLGEIEALLPLMQAASPYASLTRGDVLRACLEAGIRTLKDTLSHNDKSPVRSSMKNQSGGGVPQGRAPGTHERPGPVPDPAREEPGTALAQVSGDAAPGISPTKQRALAKHRKDYGHAKEAGTNSNCKVCDRERQHARKG